MPKLAIVYTSLHQKKRELLFPFLLTALPTILQISLYYGTRHAPIRNRTQAFHQPSRLRVQRLNQLANRADAANLQNLIVKPHACYAYNQGNA